MNTLSKFMFSLYIFASSYTIFSSSSYATMMPIDRSMRSATETNNREFAIAWLILLKI
ncbi:MAG: hypothetical protein QW388_03005 [Thermoplasmatales archaeon]